MCSLLNQADKASIVSPSSEWSKTTMGIRTKQKIGSVRGFCKGFEDWLDLKCNLYEVIEVHPSQNIFVSCKYSHPLTLGLVHLEIILPQRNFDNNVVFKDWLAGRFYYLSNFLHLSEWSR